MFHMTSNKVCIYLITHKEALYIIAKADSVSVGACFPVSLYWISVKGIIKWFHLEKHRA